MGNWGKTQLCSLHHQRRSFAHDSQYLPGVLRQITKGKEIQVDEWSLWDEGDQEIAIGHEEAEKTLKPYLLKARKSLKT